MPPREITMPRSAAFFLLLLRLAIGWHFLYEGYQKVWVTDFTGATTTARPFSSAAYFRAAPGPAGQAMRQAIGDPDDEALAMLTVLPVPEGEDPAGFPPHKRVPPGLSTAWHGLVDRFVLYYGLDEDQRAEAEARREQEEARVVAWLTGTDKKDVKKSYPTGVVERAMTPPERVGEYRDKVAQIRELTGDPWLLGRGGKLYTFGKDVEGPRLRQYRTEADELRTGLLKDLDGYTDDLRKSLTELLTPEQRNLGPLPPPRPNPYLFWIDAATRWGLVVVGACLLLGLFTRVNCLLAGLFLLTTYLAVPPLPWLPVAGPSEGTYLVVNKNLIEMLALFALACLPTGRWFGVDALWSRRKQG
jgi:uncharacterized membrane protein YphA (DoxX/SURF4 family)